MKYRNDPKFSNRQVWANSVEPDQEHSDWSLHCLLFHRHFWIHYSMVKPPWSNFRVTTAKFWRSNFYSKPNYNKKAKFTWTKCCVLAIAGCCAISFIQFLWHLFLFYTEIHLNRHMTKPIKRLCTQRRLRSAWPSAQSDQSLRCLHEETLGP